ncbi:hypothetical protein IWX50DRAFT_676098 [Phyllosticta citricarpa]
MLLLLLLLLLLLSLIAISFCLTGTEINRSLLYPVNAKSRIWQRFGSKLNCGPVTSRDGNTRSKAQLGPRTRRFGPQLKSGSLDAPCQDGRQPASQPASQRNPHGQYSTASTAANVWLFFAAARACTVPSWHLLCWIAKGGREHSKRRDSRPNP